jgi:glycosyltransferase involved in cell wall biosynthesis
MRLLALSQHGIGVRMANTSNNVPVTVCVPVYNGALYIRDAIRSVLNQTGVRKITREGASDRSDDPPDDDLLIVIAGVG